MSDSQVVLVIPNDPVLGALLGELVSLAGHAPRFPSADETVRSAITRVSPGILLLDCDHAECSDDLLSTAQESGIPVVFFSGSRTASELERVARRHNVKSVLLPTGPKLLARTLRAALEVA